MSEDFQAANNIFTHLGFRILILYKTWPPNTLFKSTVEQVVMAMLMFRIRYWNLYVHKTIGSYCIFFEVIWRLKDSLCPV